MYIHTHNYRLFQYTWMKKKKKKECATKCAKRFAFLHRGICYERELPLRNSAYFKIALRCIPRFVRYFAVDRRPSKRMHERIGERFSLTRFPRNNKRGEELRVFRNKKNLVTVILLAAYSTLEFLSLATQRKFAS